MIMRQESIKHLRMKQWTRLAGLVSTAVLFSHSIANAADNTAACDRNCLEKFVGDYAVALIKHDPAGLPTASEIKVSENGQAVKLGVGDSWRALTAFKSQPQYVTDVQAQEVGYVGVVDDGGRAAFFGLRLKIQNNQITEAESILTHDGEGGPPFLPEGFMYREAPYVREVPKKVRSSRQQLLKVASTYWDVATSSHDGSKIPDAIDCWHFENGMNTSWERSIFADEIAKLSRPEYQPQPYDGRIWTCAREIYLTTASWTAARDRHFIVDEERGLVFNLAYVDSKGRGLLVAGPGDNATATPPAGAPPQNSAPASNAPAAPAATANPLAAYGPKSPIEGPGSAPVGMSMAGMRTAMSGKPSTMAHFLVMRIIDGKIARQQDVVRAVPEGAKRLF